MDDKKTSYPMPGPDDALADYALKEMEGGQKKPAEETSDEENASEKSDDRDAGDAPAPDHGEAPPTANASRDDFDEDGYGQEQIKEPPEPGKSQPAPEPVGGIWSSIFNACAQAGPVILLIALGCMAWHDFWRPDNAVYCPAEFRGITAFLHCVAQNSWLAPVGLDQGVWMVPQWPGFYWFLGLMAAIPGVGASAFLLPLSEWISAAFAVVGVWALARIAGYGSRAAFAAGLVLLCAPLFAPLPHFMGPAPLAAACMLWALVFFCHGWQAPNSWICLPIAFILTTLAGLTGGYAFFITPFIASICWLIWRGKLRRAQAWDALAGFIIMLAILGFWLGMTSLRPEGNSYLSALFADGWRPLWPLHPFWFLALIAGIAGTMPWILSIFGVSWFKVLKDAGSSLGASRHTNGSALIWISLVWMGILSFYIPQFHPIAVGIASLVAILLGKTILRLSRVGNPFFFLLASLCLIIAGLLILGASFSFSHNFIMGILPFTPPDLAQQALLTLNAVPVMGAILLAGGIFGLFFARRSRHGGGLIFGILLVIILCQPARLWLVPELAANPELPLRHFAQIKTDVDKALNAPIAPITPMKPADSFSLPQLEPQQPQNTPQIPDMQSVPPQTSEQPAGNGAIPAPPDFTQIPQEAPGEQPTGAIPEPPDFIQQPPATAPDFSQQLPASQPWINLNAPEAPQGAPQTAPGAKPDLNNQPGLEQTVPGSSMEQTPVFNLNAPQGQSTPDQLAPVAPESGQPNPAIQPREEILEETIIETAPAPRQAP